MCPNGALPFAIISRDKDIGHDKTNFLLKKKLLSKWNTTIVVKHIYLALKQYDDILLLKFYL